MQEIVEAAWHNRGLLKDKNTLNVINEVIDLLDKGQLRVAEPLANGEWQINEWVKRP
jgi:2,3,4,5-tetrahydropyridine-2-carboxylate N-succinyltransferase